MQDYVNNTINNSTYKYDFVWALSGVLVEVRIADDRNLQINTISPVTSSFIRNCMIKVENFDYLNKQFVNYLLDNNKSLEIRIKIS